MIGYRTSLRENDDLPLWHKGTPPFFNVRALITREIMSNKPRCNAKEFP